jgi:acyl carrier protein
MKTQLINLVIQCVAEVAVCDGRHLPVALKPGTHLYGADGILDSLGLVSVVALVEQYVSDQHGASITLADGRAMSQARSPFRTIESLAAYTEHLLSDAA